MTDRPDCLYRLYFYFCSLLSGISTATVVKLLVPHGTHMLMAMMGGMLLGMLVLFLAFTTLGRVAGSFELVMPGMFIVMTVGMLSGMWAASGDPTLKSLLFLGGAVALAVQGLIHAYDRILHGERRLPESRASS